MFVGATDPGDTVEIIGNPNLTLTIPGGTHGDIATASVVVNCIPEILAAPAGLRTSRDLPMCFLPPGANDSRECTAHRARSSQHEGDARASSRCLEAGSGHEHPR